jgi:hypothetical protein
MDLCLLWNFHEILTRLKGTGAISGMMPDSVTIIKNCDGKGFLEEFFR